MEKKKSCSKKGAVDRQGDTRQRKTKKDALKKNRASDAFLSDHGSRRNGTGQGLRKNRGNKGTGIRSGG